MRRPPFSYLSRRAALSGSGDSFSQHIGERVRLGFLALGPEGECSRQSRPVAPEARRIGKAGLRRIPTGTRALVTAHHPLREVGTKGTALTRNGAKALAELAKRPVAAVLSGHVHDAFDIVERTSNGPVRMIGAGTLSQRIRSTPPSFNEMRA